MSFYCALILYIQGLKRSLLSSWIDYVLLTDLFAFVIFFSLLITLKYHMLNSVHITLIQGEI